MTTGCIIDFESKFPAYKAMFFRHYKLKPQMMYCTFTAYTYA